MFTPEGIADDLEELRKIAAKMEGILNSMRLAKLTEVRVDGRTKLSRGVKLLKQFNANLNQAVERAAI
jgi:hypothetical protein